MSADGAHLGISAKDALNVIIGNEDQDDQEQASAQAMAERIRATTTDPETYDGTADYTAHLILDWLLADPARAQLPIETEYDHDEGIKVRGWYDLMKDDGIDLAALGLTGFMWGWAVNAARRCLELPPVPNPAIMEIELP